MLFSSKSRGHAPDIKNGEIEEFTDRPLNYYSDQVPDITPQLRHLNLERALKTVVGKVDGAPSALLLGAALSLVFRRRFPMASVFLMGFLFRQALMKRPPRASSLNTLPARKNDDAELELYALKAQKGDYGKLEVIPFR